MKAENLDSLKLDAKTVSDIEIDHVAAISSDEFNKRGKFEVDYRNRAINRLISNRLSFWNNCNLTYDILKRYVRIVCPYCEGDMKLVNGGGCNSTSSGSYICECGAKADLTLDNNGGVSFRPKESD